MSIPTDRQFLLLPLVGDDLFQIIEQQIEAALTARHEDELILINTLRLLHDLIITDVYDTKMLDEHWSRQTAALIEVQLRSFASKSIEQFLTTVNWYLNESERRQDTNWLSNEICSGLWNMNVEVDEFITNILENPPKKPYSEPPPGLN